MKKYVHIIEITNDRRSPLQSTLEIWRYSEASFKTGWQNGSPDLVSHANFRTNHERYILNSISLFLRARFQGNLEVSRNERKNSQVTYTSRAKLCLMPHASRLLSKFTNHVHLFVEFTLHTLILALITGHVLVLCHPLYTCFGGVFKIVRV